MALAAQHQSLITAAQQGDGAALDRLLQVCQPDIRRYAYRHCMMSHVDDAVQEALLIVSLKLRSLRVLAAFSGWLFQIVRRECRRLERHAFGYDPYDEEKMESWLSTQSDDAIRIDLTRAMESLPEHYREIVLLRDFHELTIQEIATRLRLSTAAVKSRLHRARELIREYLLA